MNWTSSTSLTLNSTTPTNYSITKNEDGTYIIGSTSNSDTRYIGYNNTSPRFAMYLSGQKDQIINLNLYPAKVVKLAEISVQETLSLPAELAEGEIPVSWKNVDMSYVAVDVYKDADCTIKEKSWITVEFNTEKTAIVYTVNSNDTETARTAYIKVEAVSTDGESEDSKIIIVTQAAAGEGTETTVEKTSGLKASKTATEMDSYISYVNSAANNYSDPMRIYANNTFTISATNAVITKVEFTCDTKDKTTDGLTGGTVTVDKGATSSMTNTNNSNVVTYTITGSTTSFAVKASAQFRVSGLKVTYKTN